MVKLSVLEHGYMKEGFETRDILKEATELAQYTESLGYYRFWVSELHGVPVFSFSSPEVMVAHLASHTSRIRVGSGGIMIPHYSAYKVAENFRLLEGLYPGRIDLGIGRSTGGMHLANIALNEQRRMPEYSEQIDDLIGYLYDKIDKNHRFVGLKAIPQIDTVPELWLLGSSSASGKIAAKHGVPYSFAQFFGTHGEEAMYQYVSRFEPSVVTKTPKGMIALNVICADTEGEARELAASYELFTTAGDQIGVLPSRKTALNYPYTVAQKAYMKSQAHLNIVGNPEQVKEKIIENIETYKVDEVMIVSPIHDFEARKRSFQLVAEMMKEEKFQNNE
ncbi:LLM class flavin-dependent oxidoreductase [Priestia aryabhattai]|uniref:LLM class flavin-dependent oxidoreductase n=1 Tax=Priestia aryabhattai TaxID=412384 RepID=UPI002452C000|nr:LLM class flavin-dependent oxidoreductase [Priestia aryabhattai]MDH3110920.1 LLM class flavin-dependent oxidoreductase [Priestia aryabhattai]MDH3124493.1 LLM class flavin-dependent oxidoreductase [Priestia aryabhattai]